MGIYLARISGLVRLKWVPPSWCADCNVRYIKGKVRWAWLTKTEARLGDLAGLSCQAWGRVSGVDKG